MNDIKCLVSNDQQQSWKILLFNEPFQWAVITCFSLFTKTIQKFKRLLNYIFCENKISVRVTMLKSKKKLTFLMLITVYTVYVEPIAQKEYVSQLSSFLYTPGTSIHVLGIFS